MSESSSPEDEETAVYSGPEELSDARSAAIRCSAKARSSVVSHQAVPGPVGSHSKVTMATMMVRIPSDMKRSWYECQLPSLDASEAVSSEGNREKIM